jgi:hypothetical protein
MQSFRFFTNLGQIFSYYIIWHVALVWIHIGSSVTKRIPILTAW